MFVSGSEAELVVMYMVQDVRDKYDGKFAEFTKARMLDIDTNSINPEVCSDG